MKLKTAIVALALSAWASPTMAETDKAMFGPSLKELSLGACLVCCLQTNVNADAEDIAAEIESKSGLCRKVCVPIAAHVAEVIKAQ